MRRKTRPFGGHRATDAPVRARGPVPAGNVREVRSRLAMLAALLPNSELKHACLRRLGWKIAPSAWVGPCLVVRVDEVVLGERSRIGPLNVLRDLRRIEFGEGARLGRWNWVSAARALRIGRTELEATFTLEREACVTSRHY